MICSSYVSAQRSSFNSWDRTIFRTKPPFSQRLYNLTEINFGYGAHYLDQPYEIRQAGISTLAGYRFSRLISVGVGAGLETYNGGTLMPLYIEGRIYLNKVSESSIKPFFTAASGYLFNMNGVETDINVFANPGAGLLIPMTYHASVSLSLGVFTQWAIDVQRYTFINAKIGLLFY